jgi:hypothetical protein
MYVFFFCWSVSLHVFLNRYVHVGRKREQERDRAGQGRSGQFEAYIQTTVLSRLISINFTQLGPKMFHSMSLLY